MKFIRFTWKLFVMAAVFGAGYVIGREHSFEEEEMWEKEKSDSSDSSDCSDCSDSECQSSQEEKEVVFEFEDDEATKVSVVGTFNDWNKETSPMTKDGNIWKCSLNLKPGKYEYQFVVNDTDWLVDPNSGTNVQNKYDGTNSVIIIE